MMWKCDDPEEIVAWLYEHLVIKSNLYDRVDIDVENLKGD
jgi:hypothetical protein